MAQTLIGSRKLQLAYPAQAEACDYRICAVTTGKLYYIVPADLRGHMEDDIIHYQQRLGSVPDSHVFLPLATAYCKAGKYREAVETCLQGLEKYPDYWAAQVVLGQAYLMQGMLDEALPQLEVVVREAANNLMASKLLGQIYVQQGRFEEAVERYRIILTYYPECADLREVLLQLEAEIKHQHEETLQALEEWLTQIRVCRDKAA